MFRRKTVTTVMSLARNNFCQFSHDARALSEHDKLLYKRTIEEAKALYDRFNIEAAKSKLRDLWKKYPGEEEACNLHHAMIVHHTQYPFWGKEYHELIEHMKTNFPEKFENQKEKFSKEMEKIIAQNTPEFSCKR